MRERAGWLLAKDGVTPFCIEGEKLVCMKCDSSHRDREAFMAHSCKPKKTFLKPEKKADGGED